MRVTGSRVYSRPAPVPKMPTGLVELMEGLTRDVLKNNPPDVYEFCADHMLKLLEIRDGPSNKKPLSLEQKILRAQEKVKKRAEQRSKQYSENLHKSAISDNVRDDDCQPAVLAESSILKVPKAVCHVQNLTQTSEIEISCESTSAVNDNQLDNSKNKCASRNTELQNISKGESKADETETHQECMSQKEINDERIVHNDNINDVPNVNILEEQNIYVIPNQESRHDKEPRDDGQVNVEKNDLHLNVVDPSGSVSYIIDHNEVIEENKKADDLGDEKVINDSNDCFRVDSIVNSADNTVTAEELSNYANNVLSNFPVETVSNSAIEKVPSLTVELVSNYAIEEVPNSNKEVSNFAQDPDSSIEKDSNSVTAEVLNSANNSGKDDLQSHESECDNINKSGNNDANLLPNVIYESEKTEAAEPQNLSELNIHLHSKDFDQTLNDSNIVMLEKSENESEVIKDTNTIKIDVLEPIVNIVQTEEIKTGAALEDVLNEAIENTIRKDRCADDPLNDINILDGEENDTSERTNIINNVTVDRIKEEVDVSITNGVSVSTIQPDTTITNLIETDIINENNVNLEENNRVKNDVNELDTNDNLNDNDASEMARNDNSNTMNLETAAVTIQKVFRNFLFKSRNSTFDETVNDEINLSDEDEKKGEQQFLPSNVNKERRTLGISRMDTVLQTVNEEKSLSLSTDDSSLSSAATIIQAHVRGFLVRNKLYHGKTASSNSLAISNEPSSTSMDGDADQSKSKTILNIHIVPEGGNYLSRDESMITSMDLSLDGSPPSSVNLHPHGYNTSERRKLLKREDAVQSVSPPSNNSGKLSEDVDSVKELTINENEYNNYNQDEKLTVASLVADSHHETEVGSLETTPTNSLTIETVVEDNKTPNTEMLSSPESVTESSEKKRSLTKQSSDEMDVVTPFKDNSPRDATPKLLHSGEFHDAALPTKVSRSDTPVASGE